jgi:hypothetical protein
MDPTLMDQTLAPVQQIAVLRDIHDIGPLSWWPPAPGWWLLALATTLLVMGAWRWRARLSLRIPIPGITLGSWRWDAAAALRDLQRRARVSEDLRSILGELSELLRRIAMARRGRAACAGLTGADWLDWLTQHDPRGFAWHARGRPLLAAPYAPSNGPDGATRTDVLALIEAASAWVEASDRQARPLARMRRIWPWGRRAGQTRV